MKNHHESFEVNYILRTIAMLLVVAAFQRKLTYSDLKCLSVSSFRTDSPESHCTFSDLFSSLTILMSLNRAHTYNTYRSLCLQTLLSLFTIEILSFWLKINPIHSKLCPILHVMSLFLAAYFLRDANPLPPRVPWKPLSCHSILLGWRSSTPVLVATAAGIPLICTLCLESPMLKMLLPGWRLSTMNILEFSALMQADGSIVWLSPIMNSCFLIRCLPLSSVRYIQVGDSFEMSS